MAEVGICAEIFVQNTLIATEIFEEEDVLPTAITHWANDKLLDTKGYQKITEAIAIDYDSSTVYELSAQRTTIYNERFGGKWIDIRDPKTIPNAATVHIYFQLITVSSYTTILRYFYAIPI